MIEADFVAREEVITLVTRIVYEKATRLLVLEAPTGRGNMMETVKWGNDNKYHVQDGDISKAVEVLERITGHAFHIDNNFESDRLVRYLRDDVSDPKVKFAPPA